MDMTIITPEGIIFEGQVESVKLPGVSGAFMVLPRHAPIISALTSGKLVYVHEGKSVEQVIRGGFVEVKNNVVSVCVEI